MDIKDFKSGDWRSHIGYRYFLPEKINHPFFWSDSELNELLEAASGIIGELNSLARFVPDVDIFIQAYVMKEAVVSSKIEGTQTNMKEAYMKANDIVPERKDDWQEVINYTYAMNSAITELKKIPLSNRLIRGVHKRLFQSARGRHKTPGEFRNSQNWIGGATLTDAIFIPPAQQHVDELMGDLELFLHNSDIHVPHLIKIAIAHYQFETIHPFQDGNGRVGRLMITLYLVSNKKMDRPLLYLSEYFEKNKMLYYDNLMNVRLNNDLRQWLLFFLSGVIEIGQSAMETLRKIITLREHLLDKKIMLMGKKINNANALLNFLFKEPVVSIKMVCIFLKVTPKTAGLLIDTFEKEGIVKEITGASRDRVYAFDSYLKIFK